MKIPEEDQSNEVPKFSWWKLISSLLNISIPILYISCFFIYNSIAGSELGKRESWDENTQVFEGYVIEKNPLIQPAIDEPDSLINVGFVFNLNKIKQTLRVMKYYPKYELLDSVIQKGSSLKLSFPSYMKINVSTDTINLHGVIEKESILSSQDIVDEEIELLYDIQRYAEWFAILCLIPMCISLYFLYRYFKRLKELQKYKNFEELKEEGIMILLMRVFF